MALMLQVLGTTALVLRALLENPQAIDWSLMPRALLGLLALVCGNGYIVGLNQIFDVSIDTVNKPFLPIAAGTAHMGWQPVLGRGAASAPWHMTAFLICFRRAVSKLGMAVGCGTGRLWRLFSCCKFWRAHHQVVHYWAGAGYRVQYPTLHVRSFLGGV
jgi:hypothetical protein